MKLNQQAARVAVVVALAAIVSGPAFADGAAGHYSIDQTKSSLEFGFVQAGAQNKGKFSKFPTTLDAAADGSSASHLDVTVDMTSMDSGDKERDDTLLGPDMFSVKQFTQAKFTATQITKTATGFDAVGKLTIRNVTKDQHIPFTLRIVSEQGKSVAYLAGRTTIHRLDFGVGQGEWKSTEWVGNDVTVSYSVRLVAQ